MRRTLAALALGVLCTLTLAGPASAWHEDHAIASAVQTGNLWGKAPAADVIGEPEVAQQETGPNADTVGGITVTSLAVTILVSLLLPIVNGLFVKYRAPSVVKGLFALFSSSVTGLVMAGQSVDGGTFIARSAIVLAGVAFVIQSATYLGVYKPADVPGRLLPDVGIGREVPGKPGPRQRGSSWS